MAEDGRPSERGHCPKLLPLALWLFVTQFVIKPSRWRQVWREVSDGQ